MAHNPEREEREQQRSISPSAHHENLRGAFIPFTGNEQLATVLTAAQLALEPVRPLMLGSGPRGLKAEE